MHHYTICGLDNVWLENGYIERETPYGKSVSVEDADVLHEMLALSLAMKKGKLASKEVRFLRTHLDLSQASLAMMLGATEQTVSLWERRSKIPNAEEALLRLMILEKLDGNTKLGEVLARVKVVDRLVHQNIVARENRRRWKTTIKSDEDFALAA